MKTLMALLIVMEGRPIMTHQQFAKLRSKFHRTVQNEISAGTCPVPMWKDGATWFCHVRDVAEWMDRERDAALYSSPYLRCEFERSTDT